MTATTTTEVDEDVEVGPRLIDDPAVLDVIAGIFRAALARQAAARAATASGPAAGEVDR